MLFLLLELGNTRYALEASSVAEVLPLLTIRPVPGAPPGIAGIIDWRGAPAPVVDLSQVTLGRPARLRLSTRIIIVRCAQSNGETRALGLIAERVTETMRCDPADFLDSGISTDRSPYLGPVVIDSQGMVQQIDVRKVLPPEVREALFKASGGHQWPSPTSKTS